MIYLFTGKPIHGSGAGLRPIGKDPNFVADLRESFNISVPVLSDEVQWVEMISERAVVISINLPAFLQVIRWLTKEIDETPLIICFGPTEIFFDLQDFYMETFSSPIQIINDHNTQSQR